MPYRYRIDQEKRRAILTATGAVEGAMFMQLLQDVTRDPLWQPSYDRLWDWRGITQFALDLRELKRVVAMVQGDGAGARRIAFVVRRHLDKNVAEVYRAFMQGMPVEIFHTMEEAEAWLDEGGSAADAP